MNLRVLITIICVFFMQSAFADDVVEKINISYDWSITNLKSCVSELDTVYCSDSNISNGRRVINVGGDIRLDMTPWAVKFKIIKKNESLYILNVDATEGNNKSTYTSDGKFNSPHDISFESGEYKISGRIFVGKKALEVTLTNTTMFRGYIQG